METRRLFFGIPVPVELTEKWRECQNQLPEKIRTVPPEKLHITLAFLGDMPAGFPGQAQSAIQEISFPSFSIRTSETGFFPKRGLPFVFWLGVEPKQPVVDLHLSLSSSLRPFGYKPDKRKFHPHITLARIPNPRGNSNRKKPRVIYQPSDFPELGEALHTQINVDRFLLYESVLNPGGSEYKEIESFSATE